MGYFGAMKKVLILLCLLFLTACQKTYAVDISFPQANDYFLFTQITDEHIEPETPMNLERLKDRLRSIKKIRPDVLVSTGDHTTYDDAASYNAYSLAFKEAGSFVKFPFNDVTAGKIPFMPVAGNHDNWTYDSHGDDFRGILSYTVGNYRVIGFSSDIRVNFPAQELEAELRKSCADGKPLIVYHHYAPFGWMAGSLGIDQISWEKLNVLMQKYPVILYLAGHSHIDRTEAIGNLLAHTSQWLTLGFTGFTVKGNQINMFPDPGNLTFLAITQPFNYYRGIDYSKTKAERTKVKAYAKNSEGQITRVFYSLDNGSEITMNRAGTTDNYEADLDASSLSGLHNLKVVALHSFGAWATNVQEIIVNFSPNVPARNAPGCNLMPSTSISLNAGWNMVSFPLDIVSERKSPAIFFESLILDNNLELVYSFENGLWKKFNADPSAPSFVNTLTEVRPSLGYWVKVKRNTVLTYSATDSSLRVLPLNTGWNFVGTPFNYSAFSDSVILSQADKIALAYNFDNSDKLWKKFDVSAPSFLNTLKKIETGKGYWVYANGSTNFNFYPTGTNSRVLIKPQNVSPPSIPVK